MIAMLDHFLWGGVAMLCLVAAVFFFKFWRSSGDRLFALFAVGFVLLGINYVLILSPSRPESLNLCYLVRLAAFLMFLGAVVDKNRSQ